MASADNILIGPAELFVDGRNVGWTKGGLRMRISKSLWYRPSLQGLGEDEAVKESEQYIFSTILAENTVENIKLAWGMSESIVNSSPPLRQLNFGGSSTVPTHVVRFSAAKRTVVFHKAVAMDFGETIYNKNVEALVPITFRALLDTTKDIGKMIGNFRDGYYDVYNNFMCRVTVTS